MKRFLLFALIFGIVGASCGRKETSTSTPGKSPGKEGVSVEGAAGAATPDAPPPPSPPGAEPGDPSAPPSPADESLQKLTQALRTYMQVSSDFPKDLKALADMKLIPRMPVPPPGKKFAIDRATTSVVLVDK